MNFRQIHLDFHTSEKIAGIGSNFSKEQFQAALKLGHVNSITIFSKCHHGWAYHPSKANEQHPGLDFDLLGAEIEAAHEIGVKTPVYLSAGLDEKMARRHPEWLRRHSKDDNTNWTSPHYHEMCMNSPYLDYLIAQIEEVVQNYDCDGIFLDIVGVRTCWCQNCVKTLLDEGKDPYNDDAAARELGERVYANYCRRVREAVDKYKPGLPVFQNSGHIRRGRRDLAAVDTHLELESLPTGGWGYDHFPLSAAYARTLGMQFLGMTGKFHTSWGEFGGFKHPNALRYEEALCTANGAKCSIGDQMHPDGHLEEATYALIGEAYAEIEEREPWLDNVESVADIAVLSQEAMSNYYKDGKMVSHSSGADGDTGAVRILLEGNYLFDYIDTEEPLDKYKLLILPDNIMLDDALTAKIKAFTAKGGKVLASAASGLNIDGKLMLDLGCEVKGKSAFQPVYYRPAFDLGVLGNSAYVIYAPAYDITAKEGAEVLCEREDPYFNRTVFAFSSHRHTPNDKSTRYPAATVGADGGYISAEIFTEYAKMGSIIAKLVAHKMIDTLLGENKTLTTDLPAQGVVTLMDQKAESRLVNHVMYVSPVKRGSGIEIIEDIVPLYNVNVAVKTGKAPKRVYLAPEMTDLAYDYDEASGTVKYTVEKLDMRAIVVIDY